MDSEFKVMGVENLRVCLVERIANCHRALINNYDKKVTEFDSGHTQAAAYLIGVTAVQTLIKEYKPSAHA